MCVICAKQEENDVNDGSGIQGLGGGVSDAVCFLWDDKKLYMTNGAMCALFFWEEQREGGRGWE
jgi:hypothetical protein